MAHLRHSSSTAQALYQVFVLPTLTKPAPRHRLAQITRPQYHHIQRNTFSTTSPRPAKTRAAEERVQKWNEEITAPFIQLVDLGTNKLSAPIRPFDVLKRLDTKTHRLVQLVPDEPSNENFIPACKILSKKEMYEAERKAKDAAKERKKIQKVVSGEGLKTLELNWAIDQKNDLMHRLERLKGFLAEGRRVEVVCAAKKRGRKASTEECEGVVEKIRNAVAEVEGAKEREPMKGNLGGFVQWTFQGRPLKVGGDAKGDGGAEVVEELEDVKQEV